MAARVQLRKTLHLTNAWHARSGGIRTFYRALLNAAERREHLLRLVVPGQHAGVEDTGQFGRIYYVKASVAPFDREYRMIDPRSYLLPGSAIPKILTAEQPDLVEVNDKYTLMYLAGMLRERLVAGVKWRPTVVGLSCERLDRNMRFYLFDRPSGSRTLPTGKSLSDGLAEVYMKWLYFPMFDHHITVSEHTAAELRAAGRGHKIRRGVWVLPMGVELECFSPGHRSAAARDWLDHAACAPTGHSASCQPPTAGRIFYLLYAGRLAPEKNLGLLLDLMARLSASTDLAFHLLIAGTGPLRTWFENQARAKAPGRVHFLGHIDARAKLADLYANADAFVHPNPDEPFGICLLEAMASGLPLIAPDRGGVTQYANDRNAWCVPATADSFEHAVREIAANPEKAQSRATLALATAAGYGWDAVADLFLDVYLTIHRLRVGLDRQPHTAPLFYSTPGDTWGRETRPRAVPDGAMARS